MRTRSTNPELASEVKLLAIEILGDVTCIPAVAAAEDPHVVDKRKGIFPSGNAKSLSVGRPTDQGDGALTSRRSEPPGPRRPGLVLDRKG